MTALEKPLARGSGVLFSLSVFALPEGRYAAFTCVVPKKIVRDAARRSRIKRLCREAARRPVSSLGEPLAFVFRARKNAADATFSEVEHDIHALIEKVSGARYNTKQ